MNFNIKYGHVLMMIKTNEKMLLGLYFVNGQSDKENSQERWIKKHIGNYCEYDDWYVTRENEKESFTRQDYMMLFYKFRSVIGKKFQKEYDLAIPNRIISKFKDIFSPSDIEYARYIHLSAPYCAEKRCQYDFGVCILCEKHLEEEVARAFELYDSWVAWDPARELYDLLTEKLSSLYFDILGEIEELPSSEVTDFDRAFIKQADRLKDIFSSKFTKTITN